MKNFSLSVLLLSLIPQSVFACGSLSETNLTGIGIMVALLGLSLIWLFIFFKNNFTESPMQMFFLSFNRMALTAMLIVSPLWVAARELLFRTACIPIPREDYLLITFPFFVFIVSIVFFFVQRKRTILSRRNALIWFVFWVIIAALYLGGYVLFDEHPTIRTYPYSL